MNDAPARHRPTLRLGLALAALAALAAAAWVGLRSPAALAPVSRVRVALPMQVNSAPVLVAAAQGLFQQAGVDVVTQPFVLGKDALKAMLDGQADLAVLTDTAFLFALHGGHDVAVLASISQARRSLAIVARADRGIDRVADLAGKTVGQTPGTATTYFLDAMLQVNGVDSAQVKLQDLKLTATAAALKAGQIDAGVMLQPALAVLQAEMGDRIKVFFGADVYAFRYLLVGKPAYIDSHPQEVERVLRGLIAATHAIRADADAARDAVGTAVQVDKAVLRSVFDPEDFEIALDQALLLALDDQTRWAMKRGLVKSGAVPNYLKAMKFQGLQTVLPSAVKVTH